MSKQEFLALMGQYFDSLRMDCDSVVEHFCDEASQTLHIHVLSDAELDTLAGHCAINCDDCLWADSCEDAHGDLANCPDFTQREGDDW
ncbi:MAG: hypothetical protein LBG83_02345 [Oscillospiraceae bacterium]|jgi:hypothetical protein|nr:hypothetical protein [Oscillospiraceae bacterium]